ncbi:MAG: hypothetical protein CMN30_05330 [Sandaracinus sp.]|nr:hypothetical protein [Sandaracinus sp.]
MTTFNRSRDTARCLASLNTAAQEAGVDWRAIIVDASTNDSTKQATAHHPNCTVQSVHSDTYWATGMQIALESIRTLEAVPGTVVLWLNDDVTLEPSSLSRIIAKIDSEPPGTIVCGAVIDGAGRRTYGGYHRGGALARLKYRPLDIADHDQECDLANGNVLAMTYVHPDSLRSFPRYYSHGFADFHYTLASSLSGVAVWQVAGTVGTCEQNSPAGTWRDTSLSRRTRLKLLRSPKGLPFREWSRFALTFGGAFGIIYVASPLVRILIGR